MATLTEIIAAVQADIRPAGFDSARITELVNLCVKEVAGLVTLPDLATSATVTTNSKTIGTITLMGSNPVSIGITAHGYTTGDRVYFANVTGKAIELNGNIYTITKSTADIFTLDGTDSSLFTAVGAVTGTAHSFYAAMPSNYDGNNGRINQVYSFANNYPVTIVKSWRDFLNTFPNMYDAMGSIVSCCGRGSRLYYDRIPTAVDTLTIHYYRVPTDMSSGTDVPDGIPAPFHVRLLKAYCKKVIYHTNKPNIELHRMACMEYHGSMASDLFPEIGHVGGVLGQLLSFIGPEDSECNYIQDVWDR